MARTLPTPQYFAVSRSPVQNLRRKGVVTAPSGTVMPDYGKLYGERFWGSYTHFVTFSCGGLLRVTTWHGPKKFTHTTVDFSQPSVLFDHKYCILQNFRCKIHYPASPQTAR